MRLSSYKFQWSVLIAAALVFAAGCAGVDEEQHTISVNARIVNARDALASGDHERALDEYRVAYEQDSERLGGEDFDALAELLAGEGEFEQAVRVADRRLVVVGGLSGHWFMRSGIYEREGRIDEALLAAAVGLEYLRVSAGLSEVQVAEQLAATVEAARTLEGDDAAVAEASEALGAFVRQEYTRAYELLLGSRSEAEASLARRYLTAVSGARREDAGMGDIEALVHLERPFRGSPRYYLHLWRAMSEGPGRWTLETGKALIEKTIHLAPQSAEADAARGELASLAGIGREYAEVLLTGREIDWYAEQVSRGRDRQALERLVATQRMPANIYRDVAAFILERLAEEHEWVGEELGA